MHRFPDATSNDGARNRAFATFCCGREMRMHDVANDRLFGITLGAIFVTVLLLNAIAY